MSKSANQRYAINWEAENAKKAEEIRLLRAELRKYAILDSGKCLICETRWAKQHGESHLACCLLARGRLV